MIKTVLDPERILVSHDFLSSDECWPAASLVDTILRFCSLPFELHWTEVS